MTSVEEDDAHHFQQVAMSAAARNLLDADET